MNTEELTAENERLKKEIEGLRQEVKAANNTIRRAKDINPVERPSSKRVLKLVSDACMTISRVASGWMLKLRDKARRFKRLSQIWELLMVDDWVLSDLFPPPASPPFQPRTCPRPTLKKRNPCIAPSYGSLDQTFAPRTG